MPRVKKTPVKSKPLVKRRLTKKVKIKAPATALKVSPAKYDLIQEKYGNVASWAVWKDGAGKSNMEFEKPDLSILNPNVVLVGLNISKPIKKPFTNFHPEYLHANDYKLRYALKGTPFWGAYMTDIIKDFEEKVSGTLMKFLRNNKDFEKEHIAAFEQELIDIGSDKPIIIAFGNDSYTILKRNLGDKYRIYKVTHYSAFTITKEKLRIEVDKLIV
jgi:hypothetical protein